MINFYCRPSKTDKKGMAHIEMLVDIAGERKFVNLQMKVKPEDFNRKRQPAEIVRYCDAMRKRVNTILADMAEAGEAVTTKKLLEFLKTGGYKPYSFQDLANEFLAINKERIGKSLEPASYHKYEVVIQLFLETIGNKELKAYTNADILRYKNHLEKIYEGSSCSAMLTKTKTVFKFGVNNGKIPINPFANIRIPKNLKEVETITMDELRRIETAEYVTERLQKAADLFIFACGSGLAYCDTQKLEPFDFAEHQGKLCIFKDRNKTGVKFYSVLLPCAERIAKKYDYRLPKFCNQNVNQLLKDIADTAKVTSIPSLTFHKARHFYATTLLSAGVPVTTLQKALGHKSIQMSLHYAKTLEDKIVEDIAKIG